MKRQSAQQAGGRYILASLSESTKDFITNNYGDIAAYLTQRIEAQVRLQKF